MSSITLPVHSRKEKPTSISATFSTNKKSLVALFIFICFISYTLSPSPMDDMTVRLRKPVDYNINPLFWAPTLSDREGNSAYPKDYFTPQALQENELNPVSAVVLRVTDDDESIVYAVKHLLKYHFITEIYIHNLVKTRPLSVKNLKLDGSSVTIDILESDEELKSMARFTTCATGARLYCYFQDDTYTNQYMDTLYTNFLRFPTLIHANAKPSHYQNELKWRFYNKDLKLHTGYADFRYGAFVPRWKVQNFLTQLGKSGFDKDSIREAEHYFAIWTNQYPWLLSNPPHKANGVKATDADIGYPVTLDKYTYDAVRHLQKSLFEDQTEAPQDYFERELEDPVLQHRDVRSSCTSDRCLFMTNMDPFVQPDQVNFDYQNFTSISKLEIAYNALSTLDSTIEWDEHSYHRVVDNDPNTCWNTIQAPKKGDYIGLIIVGATRTEKLVIHTTTPLAKPERNLSVSILTSESNWIKCKVQDNSTTGGGNRITLGLDCPPNIQYFRAIKVTFVKNQAEPFEICGLSMDYLSA